MTIAACYVTPEGIVLGADSTSSLNANAGSFHFYNHNQKVFEIGEDSTFGLLTWNLGSLGEVSYRTLAATFARNLEAKPANSVLEVANRWIDHFWASYSTILKSSIDQGKILAQKTAYVPNANPPAPQARTEIEEKQLNNFKNSLYAGFCIGGYIPSDCKPFAYAMHFHPLQPKPTPEPVPSYSFWGAPIMIRRLIWGADDRIKDELLASGKWAGTPAELETALNKFQLGHNLLPIRDAIDFIHSCIYSTIKALKFSNFNQICGGPIELAVITTDRKFRWVWHKNWDAAISEGDHK